MCAESKKKKKINKIWFNCKKVYFYKILGILIPQNNCILKYLFYNNIIILYLFQNILFALIVIPDLKFYKNYPLLI